MIHRKLILLSSSVLGSLRLLLGESDGFAADFQNQANNENKCCLVRVSGVDTFYQQDAFIGNTGTSPQVVYNTYKQQ